MNDSIMKLLKDRYFLSTESSWEDIAKRVGKLYEPITNDIINMNFIPSSPTLMNYCENKERLGTLSSCFPMGIEDSIDSIFESVKEAALVTKASGGVGYDFSILRSSKEGVVGIGNKKSSGPVPFIENFNSVLDSVQQGGARRGAGMALLSIEHPDILQFIKVKKDLNKLNRLNLSIKIPNSFYEKLEKTPNEIHKVRYKDGTEHDLLDENNNTLTVEQLWDIIIEMSWKVAEPGIFNSDIAFDQCTVTNLDKNVSCNPCSEFTGIAYQSCNLGSINLSHFIEGKKFNWEKFEELIKSSIYFFNNVIDKNKFPIKKIKEITLKTRPIGLGVMGLAHALYKKEIPYNSEKAFKFTEEVCKYLTLRAMKESVEIAKKEGIYEAFDYDLFMKANERFFTHKQFKNIDVEQLQKDIKKHGIRNSCFTSIAPTGTLSTIANCSGGIEPVFALVYTRKIEKLNKEYDLMFIADSIFEDYLNKNFSVEQKEKILKEIAENSGSCQKCKDIPKDKREVFVTAGDILPMEHLEILQASANNISLSVSKTINLPSDINKKEISKVFLEAHKKGIIGCTVYRDGCREGILIHNIENKREGIIKENHAPKRPIKLPCEIHRIMHQGKKWIVFVGTLENHPYEVFAGAIEDVNIPKQIDKGFIVKQKPRQYAFEFEDEILINDIQKSFANKENDAFARSISLALRHGTPIVYIVETLNKSEGDITSFSKAIARTIKKYIKDGENAGKCPECGAKLIYYEGCIKCSQCHHSKCG